MYLFRRLTAVMLGKVRVIAITWKSYMLRIIVIPIFRLEYFFPKKIIRIPC
jgi:hypothetical protein